ncbi:MAG: DegQ family serine endoprotease [Alphaproteobacteria bacterium]|nr:DegQ family serine endoprotease [Alphaproteobacteria bacterium]
MREPWSLAIWIAAGVAFVSLYFWVSAPVVTEQPEGGGAALPETQATTKPAAAPAQPKPSAVAPVPQSREQMVMSFAPVVQQAAPAVVNVYTRRVVERSQSPFYDDPFFRHFFGLPDGPSMPRERIQASLGSGVIVQADGIIVTNNHVIAGGDEFIVALSDRREYEAEVIFTDERVDLAVLRIDTKGEKLPFLQFRDSDTLQVGDLVLAIGNPFGVGQTVTSGIVSALARTQVGISDYQFFIQTDAAVNPGNSGGALITLDGRLAGINTAIFTRTGGSIGIGFAIPSNMVSTIVEMATGGGKGERPWIGVGAQSVTPHIAQSLGLDRPQGVILREVRSGSPAAEAGLRVGDVILKINGFEINDPQSLRYRVTTAGVDKKIKVEYLRDGKRAGVEVLLSKPPENPPRNITLIEGRNPLAGATVANLSPAFAEELRVEETEGVVVLRTERGSPAARVRIRPGDIIASVNGEEVRDVDVLKSLVAIETDRWVFHIKRGGEMLTLTIGS